MLTTAIYPGTFNPITNGHVDIIQRAHKLFDRVIICVAMSARKDPFLTMEERLDLVREVAAEYRNVSVLPLQGLLVDFARAEQATCILRGLRAVADFEYEFQLAGMNRQMYPALETLFLTAAESTTHISATIVREIYTLGGDISLFVPGVVARYLKGRT